MHHDLEIAYLGLEVPEPGSLDSFFTEVIGLTPADTVDSAARAWTNDERVHRVIVRPGPANDAAFIGLEATSAESLTVSSNG